MDFKKSITIGSYIISEESAVFIIAEAGVNHGGNISIAKELVDIAKEAQANAVKFQTFKTDNLILKNVAKAEYQQRTTDAKETQYDMLKKLELTKEQNLELKAYCEKNDILFLSTPFDEDSLNHLEELNIPAYKIASTDLTNLPFLRKVALKKKPIFLSTGMAYLTEVNMALKEINSVNDEVILLQCTANYPIKNKEANLAVLNTYKDNFSILLGYSDHSVGIGAAPYSIPMGVKVVEKHFTIQKDSDGPDHRASLSPNELKEFVKEIRKVEEFMGTNLKAPSLSEIGTRASLQKSIVAKKTIKKGDIITEKNITTKRTGGIGISPIYWNQIVGTISQKNYKEDDIIC